MLTTQPFISFPRKFHFSLTNGDRHSFETLSQALVDQPLTVQQFDQLYWHKVQVILACTSYHWRIYQSYGSQRNRLLTHTRLKVL